MNAQPIRPIYQLRDLTPEEKKRFTKFGYAKFEPYPESELPVAGRYWTADRLASLGIDCADDQKVVLI